MDALGASLHADGLSVTYLGGRTALRDVSLRVEAGERVAIVGANGAGKSTLLLRLAGLLRGAGRVLVDGREISSMSQPELRALLGIVFQDPDDQIVMPVTLDDVAFGPLCLGVSRAEALSAARRALEAVGMSAAADEAPYRLSYGQRKRVAIAGALAMGARALLLDEPSAGLDPRSRRGLIALLRDLPASLVVATHDLDLARQLCCRAILLSAGEVAADGPTHTVLDDAALLEAHGL